MFSTTAPQPTRVAEQTQPDTTFLTQTRETPMTNPITVVCPNCSARMTAPEYAAGRQAKCLKCGCAVVVPQPLKDVLPGHDSAESPPLRFGGMTSQEDVPTTVVGVSIDL